VTQESPLHTRRTEEPAAGIHLVGSFEKWGLDAQTHLTSAKLDFKHLTVQQFKQVLQRLPSSVKAQLEITFEEDQNE